MLVKILCCVVVILSYNIDIYSALHGVGYLVRLSHSVSSIPHFKGETNIYRIVAVLVGPNWWWPMLILSNYLQLYIEVLSQHRSTTSYIHPCMRIIKFSTQLWPTILNLSSILNRGTRKLPILELQYSNPIDHWYHADRRQKPMMSSMCPETMWISWTPYGAAKRLTVSSWYSFGAKPAGVPISPVDL